MFTSYEVMRALVSERQATFHREARQDRLARAFRRNRRDDQTRVARLPMPAEPALGGATHPERTAA